MKSKLLSTSEAAEQLSIHPNTLRTKAKQQRIKHFKIDSHYYFKQKFLDEYLDSQQVTSVVFQKNAFISLDDYYKMKAKGDSTVKKKQTVLNLSHGKVIERITPKLKKKTFKIRYKDKLNKWRQETVQNAQTREEAILALNERVREVHYRRLGIEQPNKKGNVTLKDFSKRYLKKHATKTKSYSSQENRVNHILRFFEKELKKSDITLMEIDSEMIIDYQDWKQRQNDCKPITVNRDLEVLRKMLNCAVDWNYIDEAPKVQMMQYEQNNIMRELKAAEEVQLLNEAEKSEARYLKNLIVFALETGMRKGEILKLKFEQIDFDENLIHVINTKSYKDRFIPITERLLEVLKEQQSIKNRSGYVFENPETSDRYNCIDRAYKTARRKAKLTDLRFHDLRHTFAMRFLRSGGSIFTLSKILGHESVSTTEKFYLNVDLDEARNVMDSFNQKPFYLQNKHKKIAYAS